MALATIVATGLVPLVRIDAALPAVPPGRVLRVTIPDQQRTSWCWAAVALGIADAYGDTGLSQCFYAARVIGQHCCVIADDGCNMSAPLSLALGLVGHDHLGLLDHIPRGWTAITTAVDAGTPLVAYLRKDDAVSGHLLVIHGYESDAQGFQYVIIGDSRSMESRFTLAELSDHYESDGPWRSTYETKGAQPVPEI